MQLRDDVRRTNLATPCSNLMRLLRACSAREVRLRLSDRHFVLRSNMRLSAANDSH
jgi:hypothetical protein